MESAVTIFLEFLRGFESFTLDQKCITVFGSARFKEDHPYYLLARDLGRELANAGNAVMTGGGPGTMDEAFEVATLIQTGKLEEFPIIGMGGDFWDHLRKLLQETMVEEGVIDADDLDLIHRANTVDEALRIIKNIHN